MLEIFEQNEKEREINSTNTHYFAGVVPHPLFNLICSEEKHKPLKYMLKLFCLCVYAFPALILCITYLF